MSDKTSHSQSVLKDVKPSKAIIKLSIPATLALLAKAIYNIVDTAYIGMLQSDIALTAVGVTIPLLLIMVSIENIFAAGAAVLAGRQLGAQDDEGASRTVTTIIGLSIIIGIILCVGGIIFIEPLLRSFGASNASLPLARDYAFWMFIAALANLPAQSMNCAARAESSVKISSIPAGISSKLLRQSAFPQQSFKSVCGVFSDQHCRYSSAERRRDHCRLRCCSTTHSDWLLRCYGLYARLSTGGILCIWS